jgi:ATP-binding cassette subfamily F protein 3
VEFKNGTIAVHIGDIYDFLDKRKIATLQEIQKNSSTSMPSKGENKISTNKIEYEERKKQEAQRRKIENQISKIEKEIVQLTKKIEEIEDKLADPELFAKEITSDSLYKEYEELRKEINKKEQMWDKLVEENF